MLIFDGSRVSSTKNISELKKWAREHSIPWARVHVDGLVYLPVNANDSFVLRKAKVTCKEVPEKAFEKRAISNTGAIRAYTVSDDTGVAKRKALKGLKRVSEKGKGKMAKRKRFYAHLLSKRGSKSEVSGKDLPTDPKYTWMFSHVVTKGSHPGLEFIEENVVMMTFTEHQKWENEKHRIEGDEEWEWVFALREKLLEDWGNGRMEGYTVFE